MLTVACAVALLSGCRDDPQPPPSRYEQCKRYAEEVFCSLQTGMESAYEISLAREGRIPTCNGLLSKGIISPQTYIGIYSTGVMTCMIGNSPSRLSSLSLDGTLTIDQG